MKALLQTFCACVTVGAMAASSPAQRPNIVHVFADDLGYGSVGFNGQADIQTPHIDALAAGGIVFDNAYAATVCGPSRAMLLSGFHNGHTRVDRNSNLGGSAGNGFAADEIMSARVLKDAGYSTGVIGKWGFGASGGRNIGFNNSDPIPSIVDPASLPTNHGFDEFFGYLNHARAHDYYIDHLWEADAGSQNGVALYDNRVGGVAAFSADPIHQRAGQFIQDKAGAGQPFYLQMNYTIPHFDIDAIDSAPAVLDNQGQPIPNTAGRGIYAGNPGLSANAEQYAAMITRMDTYLGLLVERLDDPNADGDKSDSVLGNTLILFSSDNGGTTEDGSPIAEVGANDPFRGGKRDLFEGGVRVPTFASWPDKIGPGRGKVAPGVVTRRIDLADFLPTAAELAETYGPVGMDGVSIASILTGSSDRLQRSRESLLFEHFEVGGLDPDGRSPRWAIIKEDMKLIRFSNGTSDLYNLAADPTEQNNLASQEPGLVADLAALALAEGAAREDEFAVSYRTWTGGDGGGVGDENNWSGSGAPEGHWSAVLANGSGSDSTAVMNADVTTLGFEVRGAGPSARQTVEVATGRTLEGRNEVRISADGAIDLQGGTLRSNRWVDILPGAELTGFGEVSAAVYNLGTIGLNGDGDDTGILNLQGDYFQTSAGEVLVDVGGTTAGDGFDQLAIQGAAELAGRLEITFSAGFTPQDGDFFPLIASAGLTGEFDEVVFQNAPAGPQLAVQYTGNLVVLTAGDFQILDGDINLDGLLNQLDVNAFVLGWLYEQPAPDVNSYRKGDLNLDGVTNRDDWRLLRQAFIDAGMPSPAFAYVPVPEPRAGLLLSTIGSLALLRGWPLPCASAR